MQRRNGELHVQTRSADTIALSFNLHPVLSALPVPPGDFSIAVAFGSLVVEVGLLSGLG